MSPLLEVVDLRQTFVLSRLRWFAPRPERHAVDGVSFTLEAGRSFGVVGESGSGKSTLARAIMALRRPTSGEVRWEGRSVFDLPRRELRSARAHVQMIFQDPYGSLDPRQTVERIVLEPLTHLQHVSPDEARARVAETLAAVGLEAQAAHKYPHEFSGGQRQRIAIARALATRPRLVVADEPVSALDVSIQAQVLNLMSDLRRDFGVAYVVISHDLGVIGHICDEIAVMFQGRFVERGPARALLAEPLHPYTRELVAAAPKLGDSAAAPERRPPFPTATSGCAFAPRCPLASRECLAAAPDLRERADNRSLACWNVD